MQDVTAKFEFIVEQDKHNPNICNQVDYENELDEYLADFDDSSKQNPLWNIIEIFNNAVLE